MSEKRSNILDILKGLMILFVIITHFHWSYPEDYQKYGFFYWIDMAVPVFMIITGYLMALGFNKRHIDLLKQALSYEIVIPKLFRFLIPFIPIFIVEALVQFIYYNETMLDIVNHLFGGGTDPVAIIQ